MGGPLGAAPLQRQARRHIAGPTAACQPPCRCSNLRVASLAAGAAALLAGASRAALAAARGFAALDGSRALCSGTGSLRPRRCLSALAAAARGSPAGGGVAADVGGWSGLTPPALGEPVLPKLRKRARPPPEPKLPEPAVPPELQSIHKRAAKNVLDGLRLGLKKATAVLPMGLGDGAMGAQVLKSSWSSRRSSRPTFRALVLMTESMLPSAEATYRRLGGDGLLAMRIPPGAAGTDTLAKALTTCPALIAIGSYADAHSFVMAMRRTRTKYVDLAIFEMANAALGGDDLARDAVFDWDSKYMVRLLQAVYVSSRSLESAPVRGLSKATMVVPGTPPYTVVSLQGGPCGPEVFSFRDDKRELVLPVQLATLELEGEDFSELDVARELARLHKALGVRQVEVAGAASPDAQALDSALAAASRGGCRAAAAGAAAKAEDSGALLVAGGEAGLAEMAQVLARLAIKMPGRKTALLVVPSTRGKAAAAGLAVLLQLDSSLGQALRNAAVETGRVGRSLEWEELPPCLQELVATTHRTKAKRQQHVAEVVSAILNETCDEWDVWYGRLLAYRQASPATALESVPLQARIHGLPLGQWVAKQFLDWRWGSLSEEKQKRLLDSGLSLTDESDRFFADGLEEFERYLEVQDYDPYVPQGFFTESGFALGAWSVAQRAAWRRGRLTTEQQYMLDAVGFAPVGHPVSEEARNVTLAIEEQLRRAQHQCLRTRELVFRKLVLRHHPERSRSVFAETATQFLAGYRDWFLAPPMPPEERKRR